MPQADRDRTPSPTLLLIDGHSLAFRAYHALPEMSTRSGEPTKAVYGFALMLLKALEEVHPDAVVLSFDVGKTFRHEQFAEYKAQRPEAPPDLEPQIERIRQLAAVLGIPVVERPGYEADDVLASLARRAREQGWEVVILSGDSDVLQLVRPGVRVMLPGGRRYSDAVVYDEERVRERYGLEPGQLVDFKALKGDPSDNIPGVRGVGEKTARTLLQQYGDLDGVYAHLEELKPALRKKLEAGREAAYQGRELVQLVDDLTLDFDLEGARLRPPDRERLVALFRELEFRSLLKRVDALFGRTRREGPAQLTLFGEEGGQEAGPPPPLPEGGTRTVRTEGDLEALIRALSGAEVIAFDVETDALSKQRAALVGVSLAVGPEEGWYVPVGHREDGRWASGQLPWEGVRPRLEAALAGKELVAHNAKFDLRILRRHGLDLPVHFDTMLAAHLLGERRIGLKELAFLRLGIEMEEIVDLIGPRGRGQGSMAQLSVERVAPYAAADAWVTWRLHRLLKAELEREGLTDLFYGLEMPLVPVLVAMEEAGILLDVEYLADLSRQLQARLRELEARIHELAGHPFNVNSTQQLSQVLFEELGLPTEGLKKTKSGHYSTSAQVLQGLRGLHPIVDLLLEYRQIAKLKSTYVDALPALVDPRDGRLHTSFHQAGTETGRISSSDPNLQNIPIRTELGRKVRRAFVAPEGFRLLSADYSQIELRVLAHLSGDEGLLAAFRRGEDIHARTAAEVFGVPLDAVTPAQRRLAKTINFGIIYGVTPYGLAQQTGLPQEEAARIIDRYFERYPGVKAYVERTLKEARKRGYVQTLLGRRRYLPELTSSNANLRRAAERMAINMPVQGTAAEVLKKAMLAVHRWLEEAGSRSRLLLQIHDELLLEVPEEEVPRVAREVRQRMEAAFRLDVPLRVDLRVGRNWEEMEPL